MLSWTLPFILGLAGIIKSVIGGTWILVRTKRQDPVSRFRTVGVVVLLCIYATLTLFLPSSEVVTHMSSSGIDQG